MTKVIQSYTNLEVYLPPITVNGEKLPPVTLPKSHYSEAEKAKGKRSVMRLYDPQIKRVEADENVRGMFNPTGIKKIVGYRWLDHIPEELRSQNDIINDLQKENARLRGKLQKAGIDFNAPDPVPVLVPNEDGELKEVAG